MELSSRIKAVSPSATIAASMRVKQMLAEGIDVVDFGVGEPDFDTPRFIKEAAEAALEAGDTKYAPRAAAKLKAAIAGKLKRENGLEVGSDQVLVTFGAKHALYNAFQVLLNPGDKVLIPTPYWVSYAEQVKLAGGECAFLPTGPQTHFKITPDQLRTSAGGAKVLLLNNPCNPTGVTYTPQELKAIAKAVLGTNLIVFSDEIYEKLIYGDTKFASFAAMDDRLPERTLTFNGLSKTFAMTGWRMGWVAGPADVLKAMATLASHQTTNPVSFCQAAALSAYTHPTAAGEIEAMRSKFEKRGRYMHERLAAIEGVTCVRPTGAFYCFPDVSAQYGRAFAKERVEDSMDFARLCLEKAKVAMVPGAAFGEDRCVRLSFATGMDRIEAGLDRLEKLLKQGG